MRGALVLVLALVAGGCGDLFQHDSGQAPEGYTCSATGTCPPGQQCVPGEHVCRTPCTQTTMPGGIPMGSNGQCNNINFNNNTTGGAYYCDYDHFCRASCNGGGGGTCSSGCSGTDVCDTSIGICRPSCDGGCPMTWGCTDVGQNNSGSGGMCIACRPLTTSTFVPPAFAPIASYAGAAGEHTSAVAAGDLTGKGHASVIAVDGAAQKIYVYVNDESGTLMPSIAYAATPQPFDAAVVDITGDGKADVVVATAMQTAGGPILLRGNGDGTLGAAVAGPKLPSTHLALGDFDGDSKPDVAMCGRGTGQLTIVGGDGMGGLKTLATFAAQGGTNFSYVRCGAAVLSVAGKLDLWADDENGNFDLYYNNGSNPLGFTQGPRTPTGTRIDDAVFDINGDGKPDLLIVQSSTGGVGGTSTVYGAVIETNSGNGFNSNGNSISLPAGGTLAVADFDGDGHTDAVVLETSTTGSSAVDFLIGDGKTLVFTGSIKITSGFPNSITVGDVDGDGKPDLIIGLGDGGVAVFINQSPSR